LRKTFKHSNHLGDASPACAIPSRGRR
jgi:hypothetical protein